MDNILYGLTSQSLELYPRQWAEGVPSSATYSVWGPYVDNDGTAEFSGSATVDSVSTTFDQASGFSQSNPKIAYLTATTSIVVGRFYLVQNAGGEREIVRVVAIDSGNSVTLDAPLTKDYAASTANFYGIRMTASVDNTFAATESKISPTLAPYRVRWRYTVASVVREHWTYFQLVRQTEQHGVTIHDLRELWHDVQYEGDKDGLITGMLDWAEDRVRFDLRRRGIELARVRDGLFLDELIRSAAYMGLGFRGYAPGAHSIEEFSRQSREQYEADLEGVILHFNVDQNAGGAISSEPTRSTVIRER